MNATLKQICTKLAASTGLFVLGRCRTRSALRIFTYHGVERCDDPVLNFDKLQIGPELFEKHIAWISSRYKTISGTEFLAAVKAGGKWPDRAALVTFDDGYANNLEVAAPILKKYNVPAVVFVATGFVEATEKPWWYALRAQHSTLNTEHPTSKDKNYGKHQLEVKQIERDLVTKPRTEQIASLQAEAVSLDVFAFMNPEQLQELGNYNVAIGLHGHAHLACGVESPELIKEDLKTCQDKLREWGIEPLPVFAYPYGSLHPEPASLDVRAAVTTNMGINLPGCDSLALKRFDVNGGRTVANLAAISSGWW